MIRVNGVTIDAAEVDREVQYHPAADLATARREAALALVVRELLLAEAQRHGIEPAPQAQETPQEATIRALLACKVRTPEPDPVSCERYYQNNRQRFRTPDVYEVAHILFSAAPDDDNARSTAQQQAIQTLDELVGQPERFAELARTRSACPSAAAGGNLGRITRGQTVPEFEAFLGRAQPGSIARQPLATRYGYHVVHLKTRQTGRPIPCAVAQAHIARYLRERSWRQAVHQYVQILIEAAQIEGLELPRTGSVLVQ